MQKIYAKTRAVSLIPVINIEVAKTNTSFLASKPLGCWMNSLFFCHSCNIWPCLHLFSFFFLLATSIALILLAGLVKSCLSFHYFFFLSFLALLEGLKSWVKVEALKAKALKLILQCFLIALWVWILYVFWPVCLPVGLLAKQANRPIRKSAWLIQ